MSRCLVSSIFDKYFDILIVVARLIGFILLIFFMLSMRLVHVLTI